MKIQIICVGKLKEKYWTSACEEYMKRLSRYCDVNITELKEARLPDSPSAAQERQVIEEEGNSIIRHIKDGAFVISLEINGESLDSRQLAQKIENLMVTGKSHVVFVIGGSLGLSSQVSSRADMKLSFSKMTFPHQMMRVILLEQFYRAVKIMKNEPYHK